MTNSTGPELSDWMLGWASFGSTPLSAGWGSDFVEAAEALGRDFGWSFTHVGLETLDQSKKYVNWEGKAIPLPKHKIWKYSKRGLEKLRNASAKGDLDAVEFIWAGADGNLNVGAHVVVGGTFRGEKFCQLKLLAEVRLLPLRESPMNTAVKVLRAFEKVMHQEYARVDARSRAAISPFVYNEFGQEPKPGEGGGILFQKFGDAEGYGRSFRDKLLDFHWGNLLSGHGGRNRMDLQQEVRNLVGEENILSLDAARLFFCLPLDLRDARTYDRDIALWRGRLRQDLAKYGVFLKERA